MTFGLSGSTIAAIAAPAVGALLGGQQTTTSQSANKDVPDWLKPFIVGKNGQGGLLNDAAGIYNQQMAQGGLNDLQRAGLESQRQLYTSPQYAAGFDQMRQQGMDLMGRGVADNPFTRGTTGGMGGYGQLAKPGGQAGHPSQDTSTFHYQPTPALMAAFNPLGSAPAQQAPAPQQSVAPTLDEIVAELQRRAQMGDGGGASGAGPSGGY